MKIEISFDVWENGFSQKIYRNQTLVSDDREKIKREALLKIIMFLIFCAKEFNNGKRGNRYPINKDEVNECFDTKEK